MKDTKGVAKGTGACASGKYLLVVTNVAQCSVC